MRALSLLVLLATPFYARLLPSSHGQVAFDLSDSGYVAIYSFPAGGGGPLLVYHSEKKPEGRGEHTIRPVFIGPSETTWNDYQQNLTFGRFTTTLVLIASPTPLNLTTRVATAPRDDDPIARLIAQVSPPGATVVADSYVYRF
jgi:hypothetical protein